MKGRVHSIETCGTVDGPGIRFILFMQGCPLRCQYCHNPDTWESNGGEEMDTEELIKEIVKYKPYMASSGGGITISGGEPFLQLEFVTDLLKKCKKQGINTAVDTSGFISIEKVKPALDYLDLVLLDIKSFNPEIYKDLTGVPIDPTLKFAQYLNERNIPVWIRYVLVPNITDNLQDIENLAQFLTTLENVERIDILPFHKMGEFKWEELGYDYKLKDTLEPTQKSISDTQNVFKKYNLPIYGENV
ncbi:pyruvate formate-lyase 1-activating enzyme [Candidatus Epulonipiscium fishelsonii]|uniref:Pyruvate formate-lyase 1-activating enzyme n=1 Tax=Candidatus Epulonipiscium fishelsonii TaxID=77094 RepID=A0ACC8X7C6_9FIRM|nr:pyruvate formate-lyase 1-activating enzyme [Epulopiscium sp. SCG-D08WGA-EpuloA1]OON97424.1 MAG: pyruvate formate-lyase 1-activating enzyme [Epulopiscium sp. AS2M-Bin002]